MSRILFDPQNDSPFNLGFFDTNRVDDNRSIAQVDARIGAVASANGFVAAVDPTEAAQAGAGSVSLTTAGTAVVQNFDTLSNTAGSTT
ncbi:MAG: hypothetical protein ABIO86_14500, partial [Sphingomonas sp.]